MIDLELRNKIYSNVETQMDNDDYSSALESLKEFLINFPNDKSIDIIYTKMGLSYYEIKELNLALLYVDKALALNKSLEMASLGKYLVLVELGRDSEAIAEMFRFLENNEADLYRTVLEELLEDLEEGYMTDYERQIRELAEKYNVVITPGESI